MPLPTSTTERLSEELGFSLNEFTACLVHTHRSRSSNIIIAIVSKNHFRWKITCQNLHLAAATNREIVTSPCRSLICRGGFRGIVAGTKMIYCLMKLIVVTLTIPWHKSDRELDCKWNFWREAIKGYKQDGKGCKAKAIVAAATICMYIDYIAV